MVCRVVPCGRKERLDGVRIREGQGRSCEGQRDGNDQQEHVENVQEPKKSHGGTLGGGGGGGSGRS